MEESRKHAILIVAVLCILTLSFLCASPSPAEEIHAQCVYTVSPSGDLTASIKLIPPMIIYQKVRESISNLYLVLRKFASARAATEAVDQKADWDDSGHTMTFSMKFLGAGRNLGDHWEIDIPGGTEFINLDESKKTFFFNETAQAGEMATIRATSRLIAPAEARQLNWDSSRRVVTYVMPPARGASGRSILLLAAGAVLIVLGAGLTAGSFFLKS
ncbi:MAG: hypothetical protein P4L55_23530 [Syntrophobacteraceae bacterium]|nr:hypothetical protein [Syntrophobacteraceae bacterium]